jgi:hypothetical protein
MFVNAPVAGGDEDTLKLVWEQVGEQIAGSGRPGGNRVAPGLCSHRLAIRLGAAAGGVDRRPIPIQKGSFGGNES